MTDDRADQFLEEARKFFNNFAENAKNKIVNTKISDFKPNPFLVRHLSKSIFGNEEPESLVKALIYPRILGTSPSTSMGNGLQQFISKALPEYQIEGSLVNGMDIQMKDVDGRTKYCQIKSGPQTINSKDVKPLVDEYDGVIRLARTNNLDTVNTDLFVGIFYGERSQLSANYKGIEKHYEVKIGAEFWDYLTRRDDIYPRMIIIINEMVKNYDFTKEVEDLKERFLPHIDDFV